MHKWFESVCLWVMGAEPGGVLVLRAEAHVKVACPLRSIFFFFFLIRDSSGVPISRRRLAHTPG